MADLYSMAGQGGAGVGYGIGQGLTTSAQSMGMPLMMMGGPMGAAAGGTLMAGGALANLIMKPLQAAAERRHGQQLFNNAKANFEDKLAKHPNMYSTSGISKGFNTARSAITKTNSAQTNALLDRYSSLQRKQMQNRIKSGLSSGAAQASAVQNNIAFQRTANDLFTKQGQTMSNLALRESQAKMNMEPVINARKQAAARQSLVGQGVTNPSALGGLASKIYGGY